MINDYLRLPFCKSDVEDYLFRYYDKSGSMDRAIYGEIFLEQNYILAKCKRCGVAFQRNRPGPNISKIVYDLWISSKSSGLSAALNLSSVDVLHNFSEAIKLVTLASKSTGVNALPEIRALDHGMGNGFFALAMKACLIDVTGTEFSSDRLEFGRNNGIKTLHVNEKLPYNYFDLINTEQVMEHVPDPRETIEKLSKSLKKGGILKISVPHSASIEKADLKINWHARRYAPNSPMPLAPLEHLQYYPRSCRKIIACDYDLDIIKMPFYYHLIYGNRWNISGAIRNIGRAFFLNSYRNYFLFRKK